MKKIILSLLVLFFATTAVADILLSPDEEARAKRQYEKGLARCPKDKPLYNGEKCYSCDELQSVLIAGYMKCSEICPNRHSRYECMPRCILNNPPDNSYTYAECQGWVKK